MSRLAATIILFIISVSVCHAQTDLLERSDVNDFLQQMVDKHGFPRDELNSVFARIELSQSVLQAISKPAEKLPWYKYRRIFLQSDRIRKGVNFWHENKPILDLAEETYGVPVEIIVAIIGVETRYGSNSGKYKVINSLATLAFEYPQRSGFFIKELEQFLLLTREQGLDPLEITGSYAGAMGIPQFISSSYRHYAVDFDNNGIIDIWNGTADSIGSIANYFKKHGWLNGQDIAVPAMVKGSGYKQLINDDLKPNLSAVNLDEYGISPDSSLPSGINIKLLNLETANGQEFWLGLENFYVITRYNHSVLYAMAVYQLAMEIRSRYQEHILSEDF